MGEKSRTGHLCQFHTASPAHESYIAAEGPQIWRGTMTIAFRHDQLLATVARLRTMALEAPLVGTHCAVLPAPDGLRSWHAATHCNTLAAHCSTLQHTATHCNTLQHTATHCNTLQPCAVLPAPDGLRSCCTATHCNTLQHTATHCNTLPHTATHCNTVPCCLHLPGSGRGILQHTATHCTTLHHIAAHFSTLQHTAAHCSTL